MKSDAKIDVG